MEQAVEDLPAAADPGKQAKRAIMSEIGVIHTEHIKKYYIMGDVEVRALNDITLDIYKGELAAIMGGQSQGARPFSLAGLRTIIGQHNRAQTAGYLPRVRVSFSCGYENDPLRPLARGYVELLVLLIMWLVETASREARSLCLSMSYASFAD